MNKLEEAAEYLINKGHNVSIKEKHWANTYVKNSGKRALQCSLMVDAKDNISVAERMAFIIKQGEHWRDKKSITNINVTGGKAHRLFI